MKSVMLDNQDISPTKILCIGRNYVEHIKELGNEIPSSMVVFNKPNSSISHTLYDISDECHFEGEICFLMLSNEIAGVGFGLDLTKRDLQSQLKSKGLPWERAKSFDHSAVFSDFVSFGGDIKSLRLELYINDKLVQSGGYDLMIYKPEQIVKELLTYTSFEDGDIIMSGTPKGVNRYKKGDLFVGKIYDGDEVLVEGCWIVV